MSLLIVGKSGLIGRNLSSQMAERGLGFAWSVRKNTHLNPDEVQVDLTRPDLVSDDVFREHKDIVLLAAESSPDVCKRDYDYAYSVNVSGTSRFVRRALAHGCRVLFFSSDTVYGDTGDDVVDEASPVNPFGPYANMKAEVEREFLGAPGFVSARCSYVLAAEDKFTRYLLSCAKSDTVAEIFSGLVRSPVFIGDVVDFILGLFSKWEPYGIVNLCGSAHLGRAEMFEYFKLANPTDLELPHTVVMPPEGFYNSRPQSIKMTSSILPQVLGRDNTPVLEAYKIIWRNTP